MKKQPSMTLAEIHEAGLDALHKRLGTDGLLRFLRIYSKGSGDYTKDRRRILSGESVDSIFSRIQASSGKKISPRTRAKTELRALKS